MNLFSDKLCPNVSCGPRGYCRNINTSYSCLCEHGFKYNNESCTGKRRLLICHDTN